MDKCVDIRNGRRPSVIPSLDIIHFVIVKL